MQKGNSQKVSLKNKTLFKYYHLKKPLRTLCSDDKLSKKTTTTLGIKIHSMYRQQQKHHYFCKGNTTNIYQEKEHWTCFCNIFGN